MKYLTNLLLIISFIVFISFFYFGITTKQPTSLDYNIPIAKTVLSGDFLRVHSLDPFMYFPGSSHVILAAFVYLGFPNLFGLLGWVFLFIVCKKLGETFGLNKYMALIFAASICTTASVIRTIQDQSIDKWLAAWFVLSVILLEKAQRNFKSTFLIGLSLGMLIGTKYSGPLFFLALVSVYAKKLLGFLNIPRFVILSIVFSIAGLFWYLRNFILEGNPYYPANLPFFKGYPNYTQQDWMLWRIPINYPAGIIPLINSFLSEYMIWAFSGFVVVWFLIHSYRKKQSVGNKILRITMLSITTAFVSLFLPITPPHKVELFHIVSNIRYIYIPVILLTLGAFLIADRYKKNSLLATVSVLNAIPAFSFIPYQPKIFVICILTVTLLYFKKLSIPFFDIKKLW